MWAAGRQVLHGHLPQAVARLHSTERLPVTNQLDLAISLPLRNREALTTLLGQFYDPAATNYHRYLTPEQFTENFGPTEQDYQAARDFAQANGLTVTGTHPNRLLLDVKGSVSTVERTFHVNMKVYQHPTESRTFFASDVEPALDLEVPVLHISGLDNYTLPRPRNLRPSPSPQIMNASPQGGTGPSGNFMGADFRAAYVPGVALTGSGQAVGLVEFDGYYTSDITNYEGQARLPNVPLKNVLIGGFSGTPSSRRTGSGNEEVALDIEMAISMAPGLSQVVVYEASPSANAAVADSMLNRMATDNLARQLSCSWAFDIDVAAQQVFLQYAAQGQSFFLASGDNGAFAGAALQPADDPYITVVGGTELTTSSSGSWVAESAWNGSTGGISTLYSIPEWQQGIDMTANQGSATMRNTPDIAMVASGVWLIADRGGSFPVDGTSIAAPLWAGFTALVNQQGVANGKPPIGFLNPAIYALGKSSNHAQNFHDTTTGNTLNSSSPNGFYAVPGYDLCTGWGSPIGRNLINALLGVPAEDLNVTSPLGFIASGPIGGPFNVKSQVYSLTNAGTTSLNWSLINTSAWLSVSPSSGTLVPGGPATTVTVSLNSTASSLLLGTYTANVSFLNLNNNTMQNRQFSLLAGNGGFETGSFANWTFSGSPSANFIDSIDSSQLSGSQTIPGIDDAAFVHSGLYGAFLGQSTSLGSVSQKIPTRAGQQYLLSFWLTNPTNGIPNEFRTAWNGNTLFDQVNMRQFAWTNLQFVVTATGTSTLLQFQFRNDQNAFGLDDISVQLMPALRFQTVAQANGTIVFTWNAVAGQTYQVQYTADLNLLDWQDLGSAITATHDLEVAFDAITSSQQRWYRLVVLP